ncbi:MAG: DEAD/DEAH box helicase, partial [Silvanigrellales bacterium]|nr:DEAD/DEAH box helicase [Silvanigrellales bacterium]
GLAQTGTGKTAAFALPILDFFLRQPRPGTRRGPRCLVLAPTRELAIQVAESFTTYGRSTKLGVCVVYGGVGIEPQKAALRRNPEVLVATPGRLLDLMGQGECDLSSVEVFVLDEADRMFDMGFIKDIRKVVTVLPQKRQTLLFSATMPKEIEQLAAGILKNPARVEVAPVSTTAETIEQFCYFVETKDRITLLKTLLEEKGINRCIVFTRMKHVANRIAEKLQAEGISAEPFHSNKSQAARQRALASFKDGKSRILVATDIAARGLDVEEVEVVVNFDLPDVPETYVHRIGRAGRAGRTGVAWSLVDEDQASLLRDVERTSNCKITIVAEHAFNTPACDTLRKRYEDARTGRGPALPRGPSPIQRAMQEGRDHRAQLRQSGGGGGSRGGRGRAPATQSGGRGPTSSQSGGRQAEQVRGTAQPRGAERTRSETTRPSQSAGERGSGGHSPRQSQPSSHRSSQPDRRPRGREPNRPPERYGSEPHSAYSEGNSPLPPPRHDTRPPLAARPASHRPAVQAEQPRLTPPRAPEAVPTGAPSFRVKSESTAELRAKYASAPAKPTAPQAPEAPRDARAAGTEEASDKPKRRFAFWKKD